MAFPDDIFLAAYPKSGGTWIRFLSGNLMNPSRGISFSNLERKLPDVYGAAKRTLRRTPLAAGSRASGAWGSVKQLLGYPLMSELPGIAPLVEHGREV
jgi:hypothetical protein